MGTYSLWKKEHDRTQKRALDVASRNQLLLTNTIYKDQRKAVPSHNIKHEVEARPYMKIRAYF